MDLERFITVFIFVSRAVCRCDGKKVTHARNDIKVDLIKVVS